ncbi:MAG: hypothetical protein V1685_02155 [Parcubacteria group bacterium]
MEFTLGTLVITDPKQVTVEPAEGKTEVTLEAILKAAKVEVNFDTQSVVESDGSTFSLEDEVPNGTFLCVADDEWSIPSAEPKPVADAAEVTETVEAAAPAGDPPPPPEA